MLDQRAEARKAKNWAESDRLRDAIAALGWAVKDSKEGQSVSRNR
jgi:cysteinyl-tRNA synthetase